MTTKLSSIRAHYFVHNAMPNEHEAADHPYHKSLHLLLIILTISLSVLAFQVLPTVQQKAPKASSSELFSLKEGFTPIGNYVSTSGNNSYWLSHIHGAFSIVTPQAVSIASSLGINVNFVYAGFDYSVGSPLYKSMLAQNMRVIDAKVSDALQSYECHRTRTVAIKPGGDINAYCSADVSSQYWTVKGTVKAITALVQADALNPIVIGYWSLDDWATWDYGSAIPVLNGAKSAMQSYTPNNPSICGFGGNAISGIGLSGSNTASTGNFTASGCDYVAPYIYDDVTVNSTNPNAYDWSMSATLPATIPAFEGALQALGWDATTTPLIGVGQAFGGYAGGYTVPTPRPKDMKSQASGFCNSNAQGVVFYAFQDGGFNQQTNAALNSTVIQKGIKYALNVCAKYW